MDAYRQLGDRLRMLGTSKSSTFYQGIVQSIEGKSCTVEIEGLAVPDIRLRASMTAEGEELLITPKVGTAVLVGSLSGDLTNLAVLSVDVAEMITLHGGRQGGLVLLEPLTKKLNALEEELNKLKQALSSAVTVPNDGGASFKASLQGWAGSQITKTQASELENPKIKQ